MTNINNISDLAQVLQDNPQWREIIWSILLGDELAQLPGLMAEFVQATQLNFQLVYERLDLLEGDVAALKAGQARLEEGQARLETDVAGLKAGQARLEPTSQVSRKDRPDWKKDRPDWKPTSQVSRKGRPDYPASSATSLGRTTNARPRGWPTEDSGNT